MKNNNIFLSSCLLLAASTAFADRPAMQDRSATIEPVVETTQEMPAASAPSAVEPQMQHEQTMQTQTGDVLSMPAKELQPGETLNVKLLDFPRRGMNMSKVQNELGRPLTISNTIGNPPITHWVYADRVVYFEHSYVIHVVSR